MKRPEDLQELLEEIWAFVVRAARVRDNAMTTPIFVTAGPGARTISLRQAEPDARALYFHGDRRSGKVAELQANPESIWIAWDSEGKQQFQLRGVTTLHTDDEVAEQLWDQESPDELVFYFKEEAPGTVVEAPTSGVDIDAMSEEEARENFMAFRTEVREILWHGLFPEIEMRARFVWNGAEFEGQWLIP